MDFFLLSLKFNYPENKNMNVDKFIEILHSKNIMYCVRDGIVVVDSKNGNVDLESLSGQTITYQGRKLSIRHIDGSTMIILKSKNKDDFTIHTAIYFKGGNVDKLPKCYIAQRGEYFAHGDSIKSAINDVQFKFMQNNIDVKELVKNIKQKQTVTINEYRLLTGACSFGVKNFLENNNIKEDELELSRVIEITKGHYGNDRLLELFESEE